MQDSCYRADQVTSRWGHRGVLQEVVFGVDVHVDAGFGRVLKVLLLCQCGPSSRP